MKFVTQFIYAFLCSSVFFFLFYVYMCILGLNPQCHWIVYRYVMVSVYILLTIRAFYF